MNTTTLRCVLFREGDFWLAQCLEHELGVQAGSLKELLARLHFLLAAELHRGALAHLPPAPRYFHDLWVYRAGMFSADDAYRADAPPGLQLLLAMVA